MSGAVVSPADLRTEVDALEDAIHALAQPLTAMAFVVEMARMQSSPELWRSSLDSASQECHRAIVRLETVRGAAAALCGQVTGGAA